MKRVVVTDTGAGFSKKEIADLNLVIIPLTFMFDEVEYFDMDRNDFYDKMKKCKNIHTSQPSVADVSSCFDNLLKEYDEIIYAPISSGLSGTYSTGAMLSKDEKYKNKITVIDTKTVSVIQKFGILDIIDMVNKNIPSSEIKTKLENNSNNNCVYIMVDSLDYLKKGGRVSSLVAAAGTLLHIKPIMFSDGGKFNVYKKARTLTQAKEMLLSSIDCFMEKNTGLKDGTGVSIGVAYTQDDTEAKSIKNLIKEKYQKLNREIFVDELAEFIACHIGPNALGLALYKNLDEY